MTVQAVSEAVGTLGGDAEVLQVAEQVLSEKRWVGVCSGDWMASWPCSPAMCLQLCRAHGCGQGAWTPMPWHPLPPHTTSP